LSAKSSLSGLTAALPGGEKSTAAPDSHVKVGEKPDRMEPAPGKERERSRPSGVPQPGARSVEEKPKRDEPKEPEPPSPSVDTPPSKATGFLAVHANAPAAIYVDGDLRLSAATMGRFELPAGKHVVRLEMEGLPAKEWKVDIVSGAESSLSHDFALDATGGIRVVSGGVWAWVLLDGKSTGKTTPVLLEGIQVGRHRIELKREGFVVDGGAKEVTVHAGKTMDVDFSGNVRQE
jgi:hypothetical protein